MVAGALQARDVPAVVTDGVVHVPAFGVVEISRGPANPKSVAKRFIREQTDRVAATLMERAAAALLAQEGMAVRSQDGRVVMRRDGRTVAWVDRFRMFVDGRKIAAGDMLACEDAWVQLAERVEALPRPAPAAASARAAAAAWLRLQHVAAPSRPAPAAAPAGAAASSRPLPQVAPSPPAAPMSPMRPEPHGSAAAPKLRPGWENLLFDLPESLPPAARVRAMEASAKLREHRRVMPASVVEAPTPQGTVVFEPIDETRTPLEVRFTFTSPGRRFDGALRLKRPGDPLTLRIVTASSNEVIGEAWAAALIVYAELTCTEAPDRLVDQDPTPRG
jgi:hypothetical protein